MGDGISIVAKGFDLVGRRPEQPILLDDDAAQYEHAQADTEGIVVIVARNVKMRPSRFHGTHRGMGGGFQFEFAQGTQRITRQDAGDKGNRQHRNHPADGIHQPFGDNAHLGATSQVIQSREMHAAFACMCAHRDRRTEIDAGIAEAMPAPRHYLGEIAKEEADGNGEPMQVPGPRRVRMQF